MMSIRATPVVRLAGSGLAPAGPILFGRTLASLLPSPPGTWNRRGLEGMWVSPSFTMTLYFPASAAVKPKRNWAGSPERWQRSWGWGEDRGGPPGHLPKRNLGPAAVGSPARDGELEGGLDPLGELGVGGDEADGIPGPAPLQRHREPRCLQAHSPAGIHSGVLKWSALESVGRLGRRSRSCLPKRVCTSICTVHSLVLVTCLAPR